MNENGRAKIFRNAVRVCTSVSCGLQQEKEDAKCDIEDIDDLENTASS